MSRSAENQNWAILAQHHHASEIQRVMHSVILLAGLCFEAEVFAKILADAEAGL